MNIQITDRLEKSLTVGQRKYVEVELERLLRFYDEVQSASAVVSDDAGQIAVEVVIQVPGNRFAASDKGETIQRATDACVEKVLRQVKKFKEQTKTPKADQEAW